VLDLDIILWSGGAWTQKGLVIPHPGLRERGFVLEPLAEIAPDWCDPSNGASVRQLLHRLKARRPKRRSVAAGLIG
jgi:2-amino-4-hydroxy-6-hydroxymethyldihydropteridine diphosphokinase